ncbi:MAG: PQQ-binding-like beta-propeller repeat protein [Verrucomicrobiota bacterium]
MMKTIAFHCLLSAVLLATNAHADWLQFRGSDSTGVAEGEAPTKFNGESSIAWSLDLPGRGLSSPIVIGDNVVVTASSGPNQELLHIICADTASGEIRWERRFWATGRTMTHKKTSVAAPTPCSNGELIFAYYSSNDLFCVDLEGNLQWLRGLGYDYPNASNSLGMASSLLVTDDALIVQSENDSDSFAAGLDLQTGQNLWRKLRPKGANWTSPVALGKEVVALQSTKGVLAVVPATGSELWNFGDGASPTPSSVLSDGVLYIPSNGITALKPNDKGGEPEKLWTNGQISPGTGSPIVIGDRIYSVKGSFVSAAAKATGEEIWKIRADGPFSSSPVAAGNYIYQFNEQGRGMIIDVSGEEGEVVSQIELGEVILSTPAIADGAIFIRSDGHLWKLQ